MKVISGNVRPSPAADPTCPHLGLADDPATHLAFSSGAQRCYSTGQPVAIGDAKQERDCLTDQHVACPRYVARTARDASRAVQRQPEDAAARLGARSSPRRAAAIVLLLVLLAAALGIGNLLGPRLAEALGQ